MAILTDPDAYREATDRAHRYYSEKHPGHDIQNRPLTFSRKVMVEDGFWLTGHLWDETANIKVEVHWRPKDDRVRVGRPKVLRERR